MSTPDQPESPQLTRKQMRELRSTGATPVITDQTAAGAAQQAPAPAPVDAVPVAVPAAVAPAPAPAAPIAVPLPRAAEPLVIPPAPVADSSVDLGTAPVTRRQARQQERIRTASVPVITPEVAAGIASPPSGVVPFPAAPSAPPVSLDRASDDAPTRIISGVPTLAPVAAAAPAAPVAPVFAGPTAPAPALPVEDPAHPLPDHFAAPDEDDLRIFEEEGGPVAPEEPRATLNPTLGSGVFGGSEPDHAVTSFDDLLQRDTATTGSVAGPSTLIVSQAPTGASLVAPVAATGELIVTGSWNLPEGMGSTGHAPGTTDGKDVDATLVDGELPTHSSPTPIAASAAVSTAVTPDEIITPPAPEKGSKLMLTLAITAGVLAVALIGVLVFALATGVFKS